MKWFRKAGEKGVTEEAPPDTLYTSLALNALLQRLRGDRKYNVLDLGPASGVNVEFYSRFAAKIHIEDLYRTLNSFDYFSAEDGGSFESVYRYLLPYKRGTRFDIVLGWDLFNYLAPKEFLFLSRHLAGFCSRGALVFCLVWTRESIPDQPYRYTVVDEQTLRYEGASTILRRSPRYEETDLAHMMPDFRVANSFLLRNGFKEYLFACKGRPRRFETDSRPLR